MILPILLEGTAAAAAPPVPWYVIAGFIVTLLVGVLNFVTFAINRNKDRSGELKETMDTVLKRMGENRDALTKDINDNHTEICTWQKDAEDRLRKLEERVTKFKSHEELERDYTKLLSVVKHEKDNRETAELQLTRLNEKNANDIVDMRVKFGKLEQRQDGADKEIGELKGLIKELGAEMKAGFREVKDNTSMLFSQVAESVRAYGVTVRKDQSAK